jgi:hypothetical protein
VSLISGANIFKTWELKIMMSSATTAINAAKYFVDLFKNSIPIFLAALHFSKTAGIQA